MWVARGASSARADLQRSPRAVGSPAVTAIASQAPLYPPNREHLVEMMSPVGIYQFARGSEPDPGGGTCSDDVARALGVDVLHARILGWSAIEGTARLSLRYLAEALDPDTGRARNQRTQDGTWRPGEDSEDCHGRVMLALAQAARHLPQQELRATARAALARASVCAWDLTQHRAIASAMLACAELPASGCPRGLLEHLGDRLVSVFASAADDRWPWPDETVTYESALPPRALIVAGSLLNRPAVSRVGLMCLDWLFRAQTAEDGIFEPIGNHGWWKRGGAKGRFAQQPIEAASVILAAGDALELTGERKYAAMAELRVRMVPGRKQSGRPVSRTGVWCLS